MKTLGLFAYRKMEKRSGKVSLKIAGGMVAGLIMLLLGFWLYGFPQRQAYAMAEARSQSVIELGAAAAVKPVLNVRNSLTLLSKLPVLRDIRAEGFLTPEIVASCKDMRLLIDSFELPVADLWSAFSGVQRGIPYWKEIPDAMIRRFFRIVCFQLSSSEDVGDDFFLEFKSASEQDRARMLETTQLVPGTLQLFSDIVERVCLPMRFIANTVDKLPGFCSGKQHLSQPVESLFALMLDEGQLRTLVLKNLDGDVLAAVGDVDLIVGDSDNRDCRAITNGVPFFCGPVFYDQQRHRPVWWVAVPVRNDLREPVACLTAMVDISYLSQLADIMTSGPDRLIFVERSGVAIGHHDEQLVAQQVNLGMSLLPVSQIEEKPVSMLIHRNYRTLLQTAASIKASGHRHLPDWFVYSQVDLTSITESESFIILVCAILLAAIGIYVLSCCVVNVLNSPHEEI